MKIYNILVMLVLIVFLTGCSNTNQVSDEKTSDVKTPTEVSTSKKDLKSVLESATDYSADYTIVTKGETTNVKMVYDLPKFVMSTTIPEGDMKTIFDGSSFIICSNTENEWGCFKMTSDKPENVKITDDIKSGASKITESGTCNRANEKGIKYDVESEGIKSTICYTSDGILLEMKSSENEMYATKVSRSVSSSEFIPPATPKDLASMIPGGIQN